MSEFDRAAFLDRLRRRHEQIQRGAKPKPLQLPIPAFPGLVACYRPAEYDEIIQIGEQWEDSEHPKAVLYAQADLLARCCLQIAGKDTEGQLHPLGDDGPLRYDQAGVLTGQDVPGAREGVFALLTDLQITRHHGRLNGWSAVASPEVDDAFLGESERALTPS